MDSARHAVFEVGGRRSPLTAALAAAVLFLPAALFVLPATALAAPTFEQALSRGIGWAFLATLVGGLLTSLTPCVLPLVPITLGLMGARGKGVSRMRAFSLASVYVLGIALPYTVLGLVAGLGGAAFGSQLSKPYVVIPLVIILLALAASMFGLFEMALPAGLQARLSRVGGRGFAGALAMGLVGGFLAAPCTGPVLAGLLAFVATTRSVALGGALLFVYALGMGLPFLVLATFAVSLRSGPWMEVVKGIFGLVLLVTAAYFLLPIVPALGHLAPPTWWFLAASLAAVVAGVALGALHLPLHDVPPRTRLRKGIAVAVAAAGLFATLSWLLTPKPSTLVWRHDLEAAVAEARAGRRPVLIDFWATWCLPCKELELTTMAAPRVAAELGRFMLIKVDVSNGSDEDEQRKQRYGADTLPAVILVGGDGRVAARIKRVIGADEMLELLTGVR